MYLYLYHRVFIKTALILYVRTERHISTEKLLGKNVFCINRHVTFAGFPRYSLGEFCILWGIPTKDSLLDRAPDVARYIYKCALNKRCCISGKKAELHHLDAVGMGRNRKDIIHLGMEVIPLSASLHKEAHTIGKKSFCEKYHVFGVRADEEICKTYKLKGRE